MSKPSTSLRLNSDLVGAFILATIAVMATGVVLLNAHRNAAWHARVDAACNDINASISELTTRPAVPLIFAEDTDRLVPSIQGLFADMCTVSRTRFAWYAWNLQDSWTPMPKETPEQMEILEEQMEILEESLVNLHIHCPARMRKVADAYPEYLNASEAEAFVTHICTDYHTFLEKYAEKGAPPAPYETPESYISGLESLSAGLQELQNMSLDEF